MLLRQLEYLVALARERHFARVDGRIESPDVLFTARC
jgi:hypothetical protein